MDVVAWRSMLASRLGLMDKIECAVVKVVVDIHVNLRVVEFNALE